ncbi:MAG: dihydroorotase [Bacillota bacterium]
MNRLLIKNTNIINPKGAYQGQGDILVSGGVIERIAPSVDEGADTVIDAGGLTAIPGLVDMHCHLREPGFEYKETIATGTRAAALGGFTAVACMPNTDPPADNPAVIEYILQKAKTEGAVRVCPVGCITKGQKGKELTDMGALKAAGAVALSDDGLPVSDSHIMHMALKYAKSFGLLLISHCEDLELVNGGVMNEGYWSTLLGLKPITRAAEEVMVAREVLLAQALDTRVHIAHVSTEGAIDIIRHAKERGVRVTAETCPHYFSATDAFADGFDTNAKVNPPLRTDADVAAVKAALKDGTLDCIATDHAPHHADQKAVEFNTAANGISGFETAFSLAYTNLVKTGVLTMDELVLRMACMPAEVLGIEGGVIQEGKRADITIVDERAEYVINAGGFISKGKNSPFNKKEVTGRVVHTIAGGNLVVQSGSLTV